MPTTYEPIATTTLSSAQSSVTFSSISGSYTDLVLVANGTASSDTDIYVRFNSDSGTNYSRTYILGDGSSAVSGRNSNSTNASVIYFKTTQSSAIVNIQNYSNSTTNKTVLSRGNNSDFTIAYVSLWRNTAAITSVTLSANVGNINSGSTFTLYGIKAA